VRKAFEFYEDGKMPQALAELEAAIEINPANNIWHFNKALTLDAINKFDDAITEYEIALELNPDDTEILNCLAVDYTRTGFYDRAVAAFEHIQQLDPDFEPCYCNRIIAYTEMGQHELAEQMFYLAQQIDPDCALCYYNIGNSLFMRGEYAKAIGCWLRTAELEPTHPQVNYRIAQACWSNGNLADAREHFLAELRIDSGNTDVIFDFGLFLLESGDIESAKEKFNRILELRPDFAPALFYLGEIAFNNADYERAVELFESAADKDGTLVGPAYRLAQYALMTGQTQQSRKYLASEAQLAPDDANVWVSIASMFMALAAKACQNLRGQFAELRNSDMEHAAHCLEKAITIDFASPDAYYYLGTLAVMQGRFSDAAQSFMHTLDIRPDDIPALRGCASAFLAMGRFDQAAQKVAQAQTLVGEDSQLKAIGRKICRARFRKHIVNFFRRLRP
jgi:tetratricopeptide (TPR) repeat protein